MKIDTKEIEGIYILELDGNIKSAEDLEAFSSSIDKAVSSGKKKVLLNFDGVNFINSSGLGRLIMAIRKMGEINATLKISNLGHDLNELFAFTKLSEKVKIYPSEAEAIKAFENS